VRRASTTRPTVEAWRRSRRRQRRSRDQTVLRQRAPARSGPVNLHRGQLAQARGIGGWRGRRPGLRVPVRGQRLWRRARAPRCLAMTARHRPQGFGARDLAFGEVRRQHASGRPQIRPIRKAFVVSRISASSIRSSAERGRTMANPRSANLDDLCHQIKPSGEGIHGLGCYPARGGAESRYSPSVDSRWARSFGMSEETEAWPRCKPRRRPSLQLWP